MPGTHRAYSRSVQLRIVIVIEAVVVVVVTVIVIVLITVTGIVFTGVSGSWFDTKHLWYGVCFDLLWASWNLDEACAQPPPEATRPNNDSHRLWTATVDFCLLWA